jgi:hypothetical protein
MHGDAREVLLPPESDISERGRKMALRVGTAFIVLMAVNVTFGLWLIFRHESKNPNRPMLEQQMREQITKSIESAAALAPGENGLGVSEIKIPAATGKLDALADEVVAIASRLDGSSTKGLQDQNRISVLVDVPSNRELEFRAAIASIDETPRSATSTASVNPAASQVPGSTPPATTEKKSFVVQITEESKAD